MPDSSLGQLGDRRTPDFDTEGGMAPINWWRPKEKTMDTTGVQAGPAKSRDEAAIRHKIALAVTEADDLLRRLLLKREMLNEDDRSDIRRVRGQLAEWRVESD